MSRRLYWRAVNEPSFNVHLVILIALGIVLGLFLFKNLDVILMLLLVVLTIAFYAALAAGLLVILILIAHAS